MKGLVVFLILPVVVAFSQQVHAQDAAPPAEAAAAADTQAQREHQVLERQARVLQVSGIALTFSGLGIGIIGTALSLVALANWASSDDDGDSLGVWGSIYIFSVVIAALGALTFAAGVPIWAVGGIRERRLARERRANRIRLTPLLALGPNGRSAVAGVGLVF